MRKKFLFFVFSFLIFSSTALGGDKLLIIADPSLPAVTLSEEDLAAIYLKKKSLWPNQKLIRPIDWAVGTRPREIFLQKVLRQSESAMAQYWIGQKFYTGLSQPLQIDSAEAICNLVASMEGAVGYILSEDRSGVCANVRVLIEVE